MKLVLQLLIFFLLNSCINNTPVKKENKIVNKNTTLYEKYEVKLFKENKKIEKYTYWLYKKDLKSYYQKNILYYYMRLPRFLLKFPSDSVFFKGNEEIKLIESKNINNGYLKIKSFLKADTDVEKTYNIKNYEIEIALFKTSNNENIIAVNNINESREIFFFKLIEEDNMWQDVTKKIFINLECEQEPCGGRPSAFFKLPEIGTTILKVTDGNFLIPYPSRNFWEYKIKNKSDDIIKIEWDMKKGVFYIKK
jgi:hypothetical protein